MGEMPTYRESFLHSSDTTHFTFEHCFIVVILHWHGTTSPSLIPVLLQPPRVQLHPGPTPEPPMPAPAPRSRYLSLRRTRANQGNHPQKNTLGGGTTIHSAGVYEESRATHKTEGFDIKRVPDGEDALSTAPQLTNQIYYYSMSLMPKESAVLTDILRNTPGPPKLQESLC